MSIRFALLGATTKLDVELKELLKNVGYSVGSWPDLFMPAAAVKEAGPQVLFVNGFNEFEDAVRACRDLQSAGFELVMLGHSDNTQHLRSAMRAGCRDLAHPRNDAERIIELVAQLSGQGAGGENLGEVIGVLGCRGGIGVTSIAVGLSSLLAEDKRNACVLIDVDQAGGDLLAAVDVGGKYTTQDLLQSLDRLDVAKIRNAVVRRESGVWVLPQPEEDLDTMTVTEHDVGPLIATVRRAFTHVVIDMGHAFTEAGRELVKDLSTVIVVADQEIITLRSAVRRLRLLRSMGVEADHIQVVLSRYNSKRKPYKEEIAAQLGQEIAATIASDYDSVAGALNRGVSVVKHAPRAEVTDDLRFLKGVITGEKVEKKSRGWLFGR